MEKWVRNECGKPKAPANCVPQGQRLLMKARQFHPAGHMVLDPVRVPPFLGVDLHAVELHGKVNVIAPGHARHAAQTHHLAALDRIAFMHVDPAHVPVDGLQSVAMIDDHAVAVDAKGRCPHDAAVIRCLHAHMLRDRQVIAKVNLFVDLLAVIDVAAHVGKGRFGCRVGLPREGLRPEEMIGRLKAKVGSVLLFACRIWLLTFLKRSTGCRCHSDPARQAPSA